MDTTTWTMRHSTPDLAQARALRDDLVQAGHVARVRHQAGWFYVEVSTTTKQEEPQVDLQALAAELTDIDPTLSAAEALATVTRQVAIAGLPEAGPGMVAAHEWSDRQMAMLEQAESWTDYTPGPATTK